MKVSRNCLLIFLLGTVKTQAGWLMAGIALPHAVFHDQPNAKTWGMGDIPFAPIATFALVLVAWGMSTGWRCFRRLERGKTVSGRVLKIAEDNSGDSTEYKTAFEYSDEAGKPRVFHATRRIRNLAVADSVSILVNESDGVIMPEQDMPGGLTFANAFGTAPASKRCFARVMVIPMLSLLMLLSLLPQGSLVFSGTIAPLQQPILPVSIIAVQAIWIFKNNKYFLFNDGFRRSCP